MYVGKARFGQCLNERKKMGRVGEKTCLVRVHADG